MSQVVVTGLGIIVPGSIGKQELWSNMSQGKVFTGKAENLNCGNLRVQIVGEVKNFNKEDYLQDQNGVKMQNLGRAESLALAALKMAIEDSRLDPSKEEDISLAAGMTMTNLMQIENQETKIRDILSRRNEQDIREIEQIAPVSILSLMCRYFNLKMPIPRIFTNACAASNYAIAWGYEKIKKGISKIAIVGGVEALSLVALMGFNRLLSLTPDVCRPFSKNRKGLVVSEGSVFLILEEKERAKKRGAHIYGEVKGYGLGVDAYHITAPRADAAGAITSIKDALKMANLKPSEIDYVSAHGTGTALNDKTEVVALKTIFGENLPPISSVKSMIGHTLGVAGAVGAACSLLMLENNEIIPTANFEQKDENCNIDCVPNKSRKMRLKNIISNAFAFGGNNSCIVFSKAEEA